MICKTRSVGRSSHFIVSLFCTDHCDLVARGLFRNSSTVGRLLPKVPEQKLNCSPARASTTLLFPTDCLPMRMNFGMGKSTMPSLSWIRVFTCARTSRRAPRLACSSVVVRSRVGGSNVGAAGGGGAPAMVLKIAAGAAPPGPMTVPVGGGGLMLSYMARCRFLLPGLGLQVQRR